MDFEWISRGTEEHKNPDMEHLATSHAVQSPGSRGMGKELGMVLAEQGNNHWSRQTQAFTSGRRNVFHIRQLTHIWRLICLGANIRIW
jgi:hypothetical protein